MYAPDDRKPLTVPALAEAKRGGHKLAMLTAYDAGFARVFDDNGIDLLLVGDSLGMVVQGHDSTLPVTVDDIAYHTACAARGVSRALLVADLPFQADATPERALDASTRLLQAGAGMVKLEGAGHKLDVIRFLVEREIPVCAHLGLTPQSVLRLGGYKVQGREEAAARQIIDEALALQDAGADVALVECIPAELGARLAEALTIPLIGIGAGAGCDAQVLVCYDMLGITPGRRPKFSKNFLTGQDSLQAAVEAYVRAVKSGEFPGPEHCIA